MPSPCHDVAHGRSRGVLVTPRDPALLAARRGPNGPERPAPGVEPAQAPAWTAAHRGRRHDLRGRPLGEGPPPLGAWLVGMVATPRDGGPRRILVSRRPAPVPPRVVIDGWVAVCPARGPAGWWFWAAWTTEPQGDTWVTPPATGFAATELFASADAEAALRRLGAKATRIVDASFAAAAQREVDGQRPAYRAPRARKPRSRERPHDAERERRVEEETRRIVDEAVSAVLRQVEETRRKEDESRRAWAYWIKRINAEECIGPWCSPQEEGFTEPPPQPAGFPECALRDSAKAHRDFEAGLRDMFRGPPIDDALRELGLRRPFTADDARRAFRRRALATHPDRGGDPAAFRAAKAAYDRVLDVAQQGDGR